jgi:homoserine O-acetyltransferase
MDMYDVARDGGADHWLGQIESPVDLVGISSDWLFSTGEIKTLRDHMAYIGAPVSYAEIDSPNGHDAFLKDWDQLNPLVSAFLEKTSARSHPCTGHGSPP